MTENQPQEIDTKLAAIYAPINELIGKIEIAQSKLKLAYVARSPERKAELEGIVIEARAAIAVLHETAEPLEAIYRAAQWSRFFLVDAGHLHRSRACSSLRWNTRIGWLPQYSGKSEVEIVELAGEACCTICYPSAPVNRPSMLPVHVAERTAAAAEAAEKASKRKATAAAAITVGKTTFKTQRAAENEIGWKVDCMIGSRYLAASNASHRAQLDGNAAEDEAAARAIADALAAQIEGYDAAAILAKKFAAKIKTYKGYGHYEIPADAAF